MQKIFRERRSRLSKNLGGKTALIWTGKRQYWLSSPIPYPFRPTSHSIYYAGPLPPESILMITPTESVLFLHFPSTDELLWEGDTTVGVAESAGVDRVVDRDSLAAELAKFKPSQLLTIPVRNADTLAEQASILQREVGLDKQDLELALEVIGQRLVHDPFAQQQLRIAAQLTAEAHDLAKKSVSSARNGQDVLAALVGFCARNGSSPSFNPIVTTAGDVLHAEGVAGEFMPGELLLIDFGVEISSGYAGDMTRTWPTDGEFSPRQREIFELVRAAQRSAISKIRPGVEYREVHYEASRVIASGLVAMGLLRGEAGSLVERGAHALFFPHGIGHLIGLDVHDMEDLGDLAGYDSGRKRNTQFGLSFLRLDRKLQSGMVVSVEPGIYFNSEIIKQKAPQFAESVNLEVVAAYAAEVRGIRIEDEVLVTDSGAELLTS